MAKNKLFCSLYGRKHSWTLWEKVQVSYKPGEYHSLQDGSYFSAMRRECSICGHIQAHAV